MMAVGRVMRRREGPRVREVSGMRARRGQMVVVVVGVGQRTRSRTRVVVGRLVVLVGRVSLCPTIGRDKRMRM